MNLCMVLFIAVLVCYAAAATQSDLTPALQNLSEHDIKRILDDEISFSVKLYNAVAEQEPSTFILSTVDAFMDATLLQFGTNGKTQSEITAQMEYGDVNFYPYALAQFVDIVKRAEKFHFHSDHRIIVEQDLGLKENFTRVLSSFTHVKPQASSAVDKATIDNIFESSPIGVFKNRLAMCNENRNFAVVSKTTITLEYGTVCISTNDFTDKDFNPSPSEEFMHMVGDFKHGQMNVKINDRTVSFQYLEIPSKANDVVGLRTFFILPDDVRDLAEVEQSIGPMTIRNMVWNDATHRVDVKLPYFIGLGTSKDLAKPFTSMGIKELFTERADFSNISPIRPIKLDSFFNDMLLANDVNPEYCDLNDILRDKPAEKTFHALHTHIMITVMAEPHLSVLSMARINGLRL